MPQPLVSPEGVRARARQRALLDPERTPATPPPAASGRPRAMIPRRASPRSGSRCSDTPAAGRGLLRRAGLGRRHWAAGGRRPWHRRSHPRVWPRPGEHRRLGLSQRLQQPRQRAARRARPSRPLRALGRRRSLPRRSSLRGRPQPSRAPFEGERAWSDPGLESRSSRASPGRIATRGCPQREGDVRRSVLFASPEPAAPLAVPLASDEAAEVSGETIGAQE